MSTRYVWGQYTKQTQTDYVTRYRAASSSTDDEGHSNSSYLNFSGLDVGDTIYIGKSYSISSYTGAFSLKNYTAYVRQNKAGPLDTGYITFTSGNMYYGEWRDNYSSARLMKGWTFYYPQQ